MGLLYLFPPDPSILVPLIELNHISQWINLGGAVYDPMALNITPQRRSGRLSDCVQVQQPLKWTYPPSFFRFLSLNLSAIYRSVLTRDRVWAVASARPTPTSMCSTGKHARR